MLAALFKYKGNKMVCMKVFSSALLGIIAFIGNETVVKLKLPDNNFYPIYLIIYFPTDLVNSIIFLSAHSVPPFL